MSPNGDTVYHNTLMQFVWSSLSVYDWFFLLKYQGHKYKEVPFSVYLQSLKDNMSQTHLSRMTGQNTDYERG